MIFSLYLPGVSNVKIIKITIFRVIDFILYTVLIAIVMSTPNLFPLMCIFFFYKGILLTFFFFFFKHIFPSYFLYFYIHRMIYMGTEGRPCRWLGPLFKQTTSEGKQEHR